jgi:secretion/DNA translocation related TadE-like protein
VTPGRAPGDRGSATIWLLGTCLLVIALGLTCVTVVSAMVARHRARAAADLAALAGARYAVDGPATACQQATVVAAANGAAVTGCRLDGFDLIVSVSVPVAGAPAGIGPASATARAGPVTTGPPEPAPEPSGKPSPPGRTQVTRPLAPPPPHQRGRGHR